ncbi:hypothetical protein EG834_07570, partial [bacterium]|nr:hypothetical protein [bacterium]
MMMCWRAISAKPILPNPLRIMAMIKKEINRNLRNISAVLLLFAVTLAGCSNPTPAPTLPQLIPTSEPSLQPTTAVPSVTPAPTSEQSSTETQPPPEPTQVADASAFPNPDAFDWQPVVSGFTKPVDMADPNDGSGRLLIVEQAGVIRIVENGAILDSPFLDITSEVGSRGSEQGLLGIALDPDYAANGIFYLNYTMPNGATVVSRFQR